MPEQSLCLSWNIRAVQFGIRSRLALGRLAAHGVLPPSDMAGPWRYGSTAAHGAARGAAAG